MAISVCNSLRHDNGHRHVAPSRSTCSTTGPLEQLTLNYHRKVASPLSQSELFAMKCVIFCCLTAAGRCQCAAGSDRSFCLSCRHAKTRGGGGTSLIVFLGRLKCREGRYFTKEAQQAAYGVAEVWSQSLSERPKRRLIPQAKGPAEPKATTQ